MNAQPAAARLKAVRTYFDDPSGYLGMSFPLKIRRLASLDLLRKTDLSSVLDVGCGDGIQSLPLLEQARSLTLLDFSPAMLARARNNVPAPWADKVKFVESEMMDFQTAETFTLVLCTGVLAHALDVAAVFDRLSCLLAPNGHALIQYTDSDQWIGGMNYAYHALRRRFLASNGYRLNRLDTGSVLRFAKHAGLCSAGVRRYSLLLPGMTRLPDRLIFGLESRFLRSSLSRHGGESLMLLKKGVGSP